jgi:hypothetical protein
MMRTGRVVTNAAARVGLGPGAPPNKAVALLAALLIGALAVTGAVGAKAPKVTAGVVFSGAAEIGHRSDAAAVSSAESQSGVSAGLGRAVPIRVIIDAIEVNARIAPLGLSDEGLVAVPAPQLAGWYRNGTSPGELGSAVLLGHLGPETPHESEPWRDIRGGERAAADVAFQGLDRLAPGDHIEVVRADEVPARFTVEAVEPYSPMRADHGGGGEASLRLVGLRGPTAGGVPVLVVFASLQQ